MSSVAVTPLHPAIGPLEQYVPLVRKVAARLARRLPSHVRFEDLVGAGLVGLMQATQRFDATRMTKSFEAFAEFRIKGAIYDELRRRDLMSRDARIDAKKLEKSIAALGQTLGRPPTDEEVAKETGRTLEELHTAYGKLAPVQVVSTDDTMAWDIEGGPSPFEAADKKEQRELLMRGIKKLPERHQQVLQLYYVEELTLKQIGEILEVTESRACQLIGEITVKLRALMGVESQGNKRKGVANA